jgi:hypothetical protein
MLCNYGLRPILIVTCICYVNKGHGLSWDCRLNMRCEWVPRPIAWSNIFLIMLCWCPQSLLYCLETSLVKSVTWRAQDYISFKIQVFPCFPCVSFPVDLRKVRGWRAYVGGRSLVSKRPFGVNGLLLTKLTKLEDLQQGSVSVVLRISVQVRTWVMSCLTGITDGRRAVCGCSRSWPFLTPRQRKLCRIRNGSECEIAATCEYGPCGPSLGVVVVPCVCLEHRTTDLRRVNLFTPLSPRRNSPTWDLILLSWALLLDCLNWLIGSELRLAGFGVTQTSQRGPGWLRVD